MLGLFNDILGYILMAVLALCGIWFTIRTKGVQFRMVGEMFRLLKDKPADSMKGTMAVNPAVWHDEFAICLFFLPYEAVRHDFC